ncbi:putative serine dehydratase domain-containing protein [Thelonectria olida]|uniref:Serine dehydratase domain-containing protein n=1 Tax=Thelonectria olida TaxID=1576542 RepID=A0A9P8VUP3_9HYPO|nr:putative serine dehydratase domain-containing protein [Thelonectria olida]
MTNSRQFTTRHDRLCQDYVGESISDIPKPAAILDAAIVRKHCSSMLKAVRHLGVDFRAHVKTHKTVEIAKLQIGENPKDARLVVSTVAELEHLFPLLKELQINGCQVNILYGIPLPQSQIPRIAALGRQLGPGSLAFMIDHPSQLGALCRFHVLAGFPGGVFLKVDTGYHRAGLPPSALNKNGLVEQVSTLEANSQAYLIGLYSHSSLSYQGLTPQQAMNSLAGEIHGCVDALHKSYEHLMHKKEIVLSVGASPQVTSIENFTESAELAHGSATELLQTIKEVSLGEMYGIRTKLELHAGVYAVLDLQQMATNSRISLGNFENEIALSVIAEVVSVYNDGERHQPEALVAAGTLGLGREPCQSYRGWGVVSQQDSPSNVELGRRLIVERISQEHAILAWETTFGDDESTCLPAIPLEVGQSVRIYPNHACVTGAMYNSYFVIDSSRESGSTQIMDVWQRAFGW